MKYEAFRRFVKESMAVDVVKSDREASIKTNDSYAVPVVLGLIFPFIKFVVVISVRFVCCRKGESVPVLW